MTMLGYRRGKPTLKDKDILDFIKEYWLLHNYSPSNSDITEGLGISSKSVTDYRLRKLRAAGRLNFSDGTARSYFLPTMHIRFEE